MTQHGCEEYSTSMRTTRMRSWARTAAIASVAFAALLLAAPGIPAQSSFSTGIGGIFYRYETGFLSTHLTYLFEREDQLEISAGAAFGITTRSDNGDVEPQFLIPVNLGLNFLFPNENATFLFGTGISPMFHFNPTEDEDFEFLMGPYAKVGLRVPVHRIMDWGLELQQDLLIGGDDWINTATRVFTGITFTFTQ